ncbi:hypothetical protein SODALDRAFT_380741 [Sodiomyces alkalinus F11]|uniref:RING-type domain-containing protein n=1 Tax=Sodiomyces alkalinus (strain CBS 110278 / VKM F-3762 / F11) TaxID=1314773 RepID=A0A3N2PPI3_SODAK|nr:hypothetical protein SODALDRAFT_380741 [Sodiomyces alkalinus F11]ROT36422.1 hypothetical protein SODALDRAFT_380741 [Sodiomyces alkalinus F11]
MKLLNPKPTLDCALETLPASPPANPFQLRSIITHDRFSSTPAKLALTWPLFCEPNAIDIGDSFDSSCHQLSQPSAVSRQPYKDVLPAGLALASRLLSNQPQFDPFLPIEIPSNSFPTIWSPVSYGSPISSSPSPRAPRVLTSQHPMLGQLAPSPSSIFIPHLYFNSQDKQNVCAMESNAQSQGQVYDLLIVTDATASMSKYLKALHRALPDIIRISTLTDCFSRIGVLAYRDYFQGEVIEWSKWCSGVNPVANPDAGSDADLVSRDHIIQFASSLVPCHGGDWPEATKTGLARAHHLMRPEATTIILLFTDAPPHMPITGGNWRDKEIETLSDPHSAALFGPDAKLFLDWTSACTTLATGEKKAHVFSIVESHLMDTVAPYVYLSTLTGGTCYQIVNANADANAASTSISDLSMSILLTWTGLADAQHATVPRDPRSRRSVARPLSYKQSDDIGDVAHEDDDRISRYLMRRDSNHATATVLDNMDQPRLEPDSPDLDIVVPRQRQPALEPLAKRYAADPAYRALVVDQLKEIIDTNVAVITVNPVFGALWRAVCSDRASEARAELTQRFSDQVAHVTDPDQAARMKTWLEESYNYKAQIAEAIDEVPASDRCPCVFFDPTHDFTTHPDEEEEEDEDDADQGDAPDKRGPAEFTRSELLDISRSCDYRILRRLGRVLTCLTYVASEEDLPAHIRDAAPGVVPRMPLALAAPKYQRTFWRYLLHLVLPGTMLSARPAALLAALSIRMAILPLRDVADRELLAYGANWNNREVSETWNVGCLSLLLDADRDYEGRVASGVTVRPHPDARVLPEPDQKLFQTLVDYKMLELNLNTTLQARIGWTPSKTMVPLGPIVTCKLCRLPRSVTVMGTDGSCGLCHPNSCDCAACLRAPDFEERIHNNVGPQDSETTEATWVECFNTTCRAQYVVYNPSLLRVRAKCFYCRHESRLEGQAKPGPAPCVECSRCLGRIIWPHEYRPADLDLASFQCPACVAGRETVIDHETTAKALSDENTTAWLVRNENNALQHLFDGRSLFHKVSRIPDISTLASNVEVLPGTTNDNDTRLTISGKLVRNASDLRSSLSDWVKRRKVQSGTCLLCFSDANKRDLRACGRSGCASTICRSCRQDWYGINRRGQVINLPALSCPFCRRSPVAAVVSRLGIASLGGLREAVANPAWVYAWCGGCGFAKQFAERVCAEAGAVGAAAAAAAQVRDWRCEDCEANRGKGREVLHCPTCDTATEKVGGCAHIDCPACGAHWCFECGTAFVDAQRVYAHMEEAHGGIYGYDSEDNDDDYD